MKRPLISSSSTVDDQSSIYTKRTVTSTKSLLSSSVEGKGGGKDTAAVFDNNDGNDKNSSSQLLLLQEAKDINKDALLNVKVGNYKNAIKLFKQANTILIQVLGKNHIDVATTYYNIGCSQEHYASTVSYSTSMNDVMKSYKEALSIYKSCLKSNNNDINRNDDNVNHDDDDDVAGSIVDENDRHISLLISDVLKSIGNLYIKSYEFDLALEYHQESFSLREKVLGSDESTRKDHDDSFTTEASATKKDINTTLRIKKKIDMLKKKKSTIISRSSIKNIRKSTTAAVMKVGEGGNNNNNNSPTDIDRREMKPIFPSSSTALKIPSTSVDDRSSSHDKSDDDSNLSISSSCSSVKIENLKSRKRGLEKILSVSQRHRQRNNYKKLDSSSIPSDEREERERDTNDNEKFNNESDSDNYSNTSFGDIVTKDKNWYQHNDSDENTTGSGDDKQVHISFDDGTNIPSFQTNRRKDKSSKGVCRKRKRHDVETNNRDIGGIRKRSRYKRTTTTSSSSDDTSVADISAASLPFDVTSDSGSNSRTIIDDLKKHRISLEKRLSLSRVGYNILKERRKDKEDDDDKLSSSPNSKGRGSMEQQYKNRKRRKLVPPVLGGGNVHDVFRHRDKGYHYYSPPYKDHKLDCQEVEDFPSWYDSLYEKNQDNASAKSSVKLNNSADSSDSSEVYRDDDSVTLSRCSSKQLQSSIQSSGSQEYWDDDSVSVSLSSINNNDKNKDVVAVQIKRLLNTTIESSSDDDTVSVLLYDDVNNSFGEQDDSKEKIQQHTGVSNDDDNEDDNDTRDNSLNTQVRNEEAASSIFRNHQRLFSFDGSFPELLEEPTDWTPLRSSDNADEPFKTANDGFDSSFVATAWPYRGKNSLSNSSFIHDDDSLLYSPISKTMADEVSFSDNWTDMINVEEMTGLKNEGMCQSEEERPNGIPRLPIKKGGFCSVEETLLSENYDEPTKVCSQVSSDDESKPFDEIADESSNQRNVSFSSNISAMKGSVGRLRIRQSPISKCNDVTGLLAEPLIGASMIPLPQYAPAPSYLGRSREHVKDDIPDLVNTSDLSSFTLISPPVLNEQEILEKFRALQDRSLASIRRSTSMETLSSSRTTIPARKRHSLWTIKQRAARDAIARFVLYSIIMRFLLMAGETIIGSSALWQSKLSVLPPTSTLLQRIFMVFHFIGVFYSFCEFQRIINEKEYKSREEGRQLSERAMQKRTVKSEKNKASPTKRNRSWFVVISRLCVLLAMIVSVFYGVAYFSGRGISVPSKVEVSTSMNGTLPTTVEDNGTMITENKDLASKVISRTHQPSLQSDARHGNNASRFFPGRSMLGIEDDAEIITNQTSEDKHKRKRNRKTRHATSNGRADKADSPGSTLARSSTAPTEDTTTNNDKKELEGKVDNLISTSLDAEAVTGKAPAGSHGRRLSTAIIEKNITSANGVKCQRRERTKSSHIFSNSLVAFTNEFYGSTTTNNKERITAVSGEDDVTTKPTLVKQMSLTDKVRNQRKRGGPRTKRVLSILFTVIKSATVYNWV